jgi:rubrerythrin
LLSRRALLGSAVVAGGIVATELAAPAASAPSPAQDARILNFALLLEYLTAAFYGETVDKGAVRGELRRFAQVVGAHERAHVALLRKVLGKKARPRPRLDFGTATSEPKRYLAAAITLEDTGVAAYNGQAANLTPHTLAAAAEIVSVEARHAAWARALGGQLPAIAATDPLASEAQVLATLRKTGFLKGG